MMFGTSASLSISLDESFFFLRPSVDPEHIPSEDPIVRGSLTLSLTKLKRIKSLVVRVVSNYSINFGPPDYFCEYGQNTISEVYLHEDASERVWAKGNHTFMFALVIPSSTAPLEHCGHGCISHKIVAISQGDGFANANFETSVPIFLVVNPAPVGETSDLHLSTQGYKEELGPYAATAASQHLTVGGLIEFDYRLACVPTTLKIISVSAFLDTTFRIISVKDKSRKLKRTSRRTLLFEVNADRPINEDTRLEAAQADGTRVTPLVNVSTMPVRFSTPSACNPLIVLQPGGSMHLSQSTRLPLDHVIRPSTLKGTKTPIEIHHELTLRITFQRVDDPSPNPRLALKVNHPITLSSCVCTLPSLLVPAYSEAISSDPSGSRDASKRALNPMMTRSVTCVCNATKDQLLELYQKMDARLLAGCTSTDDTSHSTAKLVPSPYRGRSTSGS